MPIKYLNFFKIQVLIFILISSMILAGLFFIYLYIPVDFTPLEYYQNSNPSILLAHDGTEWARFEISRKDIITIGELPKHLINAFLAAEDGEFFTHHGISLRGIIRSSLVNLSNRNRAQGASTITQQLVKQLFLDSKKSFTRKIKEQFVALAVESKFTKEHILQTYLNHVYFGAGIYGIEAAAQRFWAICAKDLNIHQSATLAAILKSPKKYCPIYNKENSKKRRDAILKNMLISGMINKNQYEFAIKQEIETIDEDKYSKAPHLKESIRNYLEDLLGKKELYTKGFKIQTTIDPEIQEKAELIFKSRIKTLRSEFNEEIDGAMISLDTKTGEIKAVIGGLDYNKSKFNRAFSAKRQLGSIFKPIIYSAALEMGLSLADLATDEQIIFNDYGNIWSPRNSIRKFEGQMTLARALYRSNNIISIKTLLSVGLDPVIDLAYKSGIIGPIGKHKSIALGCIDATIKEACGMFNIFANNGIFVQPHYIKWVKDEWGNKIHNFVPIKRRVISSKTASQIAKVLSISMEKHFENTNLSSMQSIGKTGTTNGARTCWFMGATPKLMTGFYIGCDNNKELGKSVFSSKTVLPMWVDFNKSLNHESVNLNFKFDESLKEVTINSKTGDMIFDKSLSPYAISILVKPERIFSGKLIQTSIDKFAKIKANYISLP